MAKLIINPTSGAKKEIPLGEKIVSIGRDPSNDLVLSDAMVSRRHAIMERRGDQYVLRDNNSSNGTLVNGDRVVGELTLRDGDLIAIGSARLLFQLEEIESAPPRPPLPTTEKEPPPPSRRAGDVSCPACGFVSGPTDRYCRRCGREIPAAPERQVICASCNSPVALPAEFCGTCGKILLKQQEKHYLPTQLRARETGPSVREARAAESGPTPMVPPVPRPTAKLSTVSRALERPPIRKAAAPVAMVREEPAGFWVRLVAYLIDGFIISLPMLIAVGLMLVLYVPQSGGLGSGEVSPLAIALPLMGGFLTFLLSVVYPLYFWAAQGATPGKRLLGLKVVTAEGKSPIGFRRAALRLLGYFLNGFTFGIGFLLIAFTPDKKGLHDRIADTSVVKRA